MCYYTQKKNQTDSKPPQGGEKGLRWGVAQALVFLGIHPEGRQKQLKQWVSGPHLGLGRLHVTVWRTDWTGRKEAGAQKICKISLKI